METEQDIQPIKPETSRQSHLKEPDVLLAWEIAEEKYEYSKDRERILIVVGAVATIIAILLSTYVLATMLVISTGVFVWLSRKEPNVNTFEINEFGILIGDKLVEFSDVTGYNIIDDPDETARLILEDVSLFRERTVVPIYDIDVNVIETVLEENNVKYNPELNVSFLDFLVRFI